MQLFYRFYLTAIEWLRRLRRKLFLTEYDLIEFIQAWEKQKEEIRTVERNMLINCVTKSEFDQKLHAAANDIRSLKMLLGKFKKEHKASKDIFNYMEDEVVKLNKWIHAIPRDVDYRKREIDHELQKMINMRQDLFGKMDNLRSDYSLYNSSIVRLSSRITGLEKILQSKGEL